MRARLVVNALVHQDLIPGVQSGSKVRADEHGRLIEVMSANRPLHPGPGCLWCNQLIDQNQLAKEAKTDEERRIQAYGVEEPNPSVISLNAIAASHAVNDFLFDYLTLARSGRFTMPRDDSGWPECSQTGVSIAPRGASDRQQLPHVQMPACTRGLGLRQRLVSQSRNNG